RDFHVTGVQTCALPIFHIEVTPVPFSELSAERDSEKSVEMRDRVIKARKVQQQRYSGKKIHSNAQMGSNELREICRIDATGKARSEERRAGKEGRVRVG